MELGRSVMEVSVQLGEGQPTERSERQVVRLLNRKVHVVQGAETDVLETGTNGHEGGRRHKGTVVSVDI